MFARPITRALRAQPTANAFNRTFSTTPRPQFAKMTIIGRLAAEPEQSSTATGQDVVRYALGTSYGPAENRQTSWFKVASFVEGGRRDYLLKLPKGTLVHVEADARMTKYEDAEGKPQSRLSLVQRTIEVLSRPAAAAEQEQS